MNGATGTDRSAILAAVLREFERWYQRWASGPQPGDAAASGLRAEYIRYCATLGQEVRVELPGGGVLTGRASDVDDVGRLLVTGPDGVQAVSAGRRRARPLTRPGACLDRRQSARRGHVSAIDATMGGMASTTGLTEGEELVLRLHPHWKTVLRPILILAATIVALLAVLIFLPAGHGSAVARLALGAVALIIALTWVVVPVLRWRTTSYELTNRRLRLRAGILTRSGRDFPLAKISDVSFAQGILDRVLGCGRLIVESPGEHGQLVLTEIPQVQGVQSTLFQLVGDEQARLAREQP